MACDILLFVSSRLQQSNLLSILTDSESVDWRGEIMKELGTSILRHASAAGVVLDPTNAWKLLSRELGGARRIVITIKW